ncbi:MAG: manganese efflux pump [Clostridia bacterium]|nr:manganese efflux pump [Clostridia bacterium]
MGFIDLLLLSFSLAADAFSVSLCKGLNLKKNLLRNALIISAFFGGFQALMPALGWLLGKGLAVYIEKYGHYIACGILCFIGIKMIVDAIRGGEKIKDGIDIKELLILSVATSIDALAVGFSFALNENVGIILSCAVIGAVTFAVCVGGVFLGHAFGTKFGKPANIAGGCVLIILGVKMLLEGIGII